MPLPTVITQTGAGSTNPVLVDRYQDPIAIGIACVVTGTVNYTVQYSYDNPPVTWFPDAVLATQTATKDNPGFTVPCQWLRLTVNSGTGSVTMTVVQGSPNT